MSKSQNKLNKESLVQKYTEGQTHMQIINLAKLNYKILYSIINGSTDQPDHPKKEEQKILVDLIMTQAYARIGMILAIVCLETVAFICMIGAIIKQDGSWRKIFKSQKDRDGKE